MNTTSCHENDRLTLADAYRIVNGETDGCEACTELAWRLVDADLEDEWAGHRFGSATTINFNAWPYRCIDWQQVADELRQDYTSVSFDGITYWVR